MFYVWQCMHACIIHILLHVIYFLKIYLYQLFYSSISIIFTIMKVIHIKKRLESRQSVRQLHTADTAYIQFHSFHDTSRISGDGHWWCTCLPIIGAILSSRQMSQLVHIALTATSSFGCTPVWICRAWSEVYVRYCSSAGYSDRGKISLWLSYILPWQIWWLKM